MASWTEIQFWLFVKMVLAILYDNTRQEDAEIMNAF